MLNKNFLSALTCEICSTISKEEDEQAWLAARTKGIGGSDIGTICGVNDFSSPRTLYLSKIGMYEDDHKEAAIERMHFGNVLEPIVANEYAKRTSKRVAVSPATFSHSEYKWAIANIDRFIIDDDGIPYGILECKTASEYMNSDWFDGDVPLSYIYQVQWYMFVTGLKHAAIAALVGGNKFYTYEIPYNATIVDNILFPKAKFFWEENVLKLVEPPLSGSKLDVEEVKEKYAECVKGSEIQLPDESINELADLIVSTKVQIKKLETIKAEAENRIKELMKENEIAYTADHIIKWSPRSQQRVNTDVLRSSYPEVYEACKKQINFRVFTVK